MAEVRLTLLPYLQEWDGSHLRIRLLFAPRISPKESLVAGSNGPSLAKAEFKLDFHVASADNMPTPGAKVVATLPSPALVDAEAIFDEFETQLQPQLVNKLAKKPRGVQVRKHLPVSYRDVVSPGTRQAQLFSTDNSYRCALRHQDVWPPRYTKLPEPPKITWGHVVAAILKSAPLAEAAGLVRTFTIPINNIEDVQSGSFLYVTLSQGSDAFELQTGDFLKSYATKIPPLAAATPRGLFTPCLFSVSSDPTSISYDEIFGEVEDYLDGFANVVHCNQQQFVDPLQEVNDNTRPLREQGVRLGWDDEQVTIWMNRQLDSTVPDFDAPLGVSGYRVDVRLIGTTQWLSLVQAEGTIVIGSVNLGLVKTELSTSVQPVQQEVTPNQPLSGNFWLSQYFTSWSGSSLAGHDAFKSTLSGNPNPQSSALRGVVPQIRLTYGKTYEFQVRLMDNTGGGPDSGSARTFPGGNSISQILFRRFVRPSAPRVTDLTTFPAEPDSTNAPSSLRVRRPLLQYPAVACIEANSTVSMDELQQSLLADRPEAIAEHREIGLADSDVDRLQITVEVKSVPQDPLATDSTFIPVYTTTRQFPNDNTGELVVTLQWTDCNNVWDLRTGQNQTQGPLSVPTARHVRLRLASLCKDDLASPPAYFGAQDVRLSNSVTVNIRKESQSEPNVFDLSSERELLNAYILQPDSSLNGPSVPAVTFRFANAIGLRANDQTLKAEPGRRIVFACSAALRHTIGPDGGSIRFATSADLARRWIIVSRLTIRRDWTWDGFAKPGIRILRDGVEIAIVNFPFSINPDVFTKDEAQIVPARTKIEVFIFDAITPVVPPGQSPDVLKPSYTVTTSFINATAQGQTVTASIILPVTVNPTQIPKLKSVGLAMSPYESSRSSAPDYSYTIPRTKCLWLEFAEPLQDKNDGIFARVLRNAPDPLLLPAGAHTAVPAIVPPLGIDPEFLVHIGREQAAGTSGLEAMTQMIPANNSSLHYALPLPVEVKSPELFGFWSYEFRIGHTKQVWSTAQGRFGPGLIVNSVQHPAPPLLCKVKRVCKGIQCSALHAAPVVDGTVYPGRDPRTTMWFLLYAQALQIDGADARNILLTVSQGFVNRDQPESVTDAARYIDAWSNVFIHSSDIFGWLDNLGLDGKAGLSVIAVEVYGSPTIFDPLKADLGKQRILRASPLTAVPSTC